MSGFRLQQDVLITAETMMAINSDLSSITFGFFLSLTDQLWWKYDMEIKPVMGTPCADRSFLNGGNLRFWSASLVTLVTNLQASGSLGSSLLWVALAPWPVKKPTQRLILCATKGQMKPQLDRSWRGRIPTSFSGCTGQMSQKQS